MGVVDLYMTDFCPFAQRAWLAFLEKEVNPTQPELFRYIEVNFFNPSLPLTQEFLKLSKTVPAGWHEGQPLLESLPIAYWVDAQYKQNPLQPASQEGIEHMKAVIEKYTKGEFDITGAFYQFLMMDEETPFADAAAQSAKLLAAYRELSNELAAGGGPYLLGSQFTIADIALIPFVDRAMLALAHYKKWSLPQTDEFAPFRAWREAYQARPAYQITNADRLPRSVEVQPFAATKRDDYLLEVYASYANNVRTEGRAQLLTAPPGVATQDIAAAKAAKKAAKEAEALAAKPKCKVGQHMVCALGTVAIVALVGVAVAKVVKLIKERK